MPAVTESVASEYREAWAAWEKQLRALHEVFLEGKKLDPVRIKGLLNREARAKDRYDTARRRLLGLSEE